MSRGIEADKSALRDVCRREGRSDSIYHLLASSLTRPTVRSIVQSLDSSLHLKEGEPRNQVSRGFEASIESVCVEIGA